MLKNEIGHLILKSILTLGAAVFFSVGCIRLTGGAGVWKQGADDSSPVTHQVGFDTNQILPQKDSADIKS